MTEGDGRNTGTILEVVSGMTSFSEVTGGKAGMWVQCYSVGRHGESLEVPADGQKWGRRKSVTQDRGRLSAVSYSVLVWQD